MDSRATMKEVAKRAGVAVITVSRVFRNDPHVLPATRQKVLECANAVGYRKNPLVSAWMANLRRAKGRPAAQQTLAFLTAESTPEGWRDRLTIRNYFEGADARAGELGFKLEHFWLAEKGMSGTRMSQVLRARGICGLLVGPLRLAFSERVSLEWENFAAIALGYSLRKPGLHRVSNHQVRSIRLAIDELQRLGYRRIGLAIERRRNDRVDQNWTSGFLPYQWGLPPEDRVPPFLPERMNGDTLLRWVEECQPEVILGGFQAYQSLTAAGVKIPEEIGFASLEVYPEHGAMAGIDQNSRTIGVAAVEFLAEQLYHNMRGVPAIPRIVLVEGKWQAGPTVRSLCPSPVR